MSAATTDWRLTARQLQGTCRLDLRRALLSPRSLALYFLAFGPLLLVTVWALTPLPSESFSGPQEAVKVFAVLFEFYVRVSIFFSAMFLFVSLYRSEILERSLHYYLLTPVRREVVALGKYLAALIASGPGAIGDTASRVAARARLRSVPAVWEALARLCPDNAMVVDPSHAVPGAQRGLTLSFKQVLYTVVLLCSASVYRRERAD